MPGAERAADAYEGLVEHVSRDQDTVGLILGGGRGKGVYSDRSDFDVYVVLSDLASRSAIPEVADPMVEVIPTSLEELQEIAGQWDHPLRWNRYTFAHVTPVLDKSDGSLQAVLDLMELVPHDRRDAHLRECLDGYVNATYRSLKNRDDGERAGAILDAAESVCPLLEYLFGLDGRVRPYNKFLGWELDHHPLPEVDLGSQEFLRAMEQVGSGDAAPQRQMYTRVEAMARRHGLGDVIDAWGEHALAVLRGSR